MLLVSVPDTNKSARNKQEQGKRRQPCSAMSVQSDCLMDDDMAGWGKSQSKSLAASHLANLPKDIAVQWH